MGPQLLSASGSRERNSPELQRSCRSESFRWTEPVPGASARFCFARSRRATVAITARSPSLCITSGLDS
jgi:hypothetical protein